MTPGTRAVEIPGSNPYKKNVHEVKVILISDVHYFCIHSFSLYIHYFE